MKLPEVIKDYLLLAIKIAAVVVVVFGLGSGINHTLSLKKQLETVFSDSLVRGENIKSTKLSHRLDSFDNTKKQTGFDESILKSISNKFSKVIDRYLPGTNVFAQQEPSVDDRYIVTFTTKCGWRIGAIHGASSSNNYPELPPFGQSLFYRDTCQDQNGNGSYEPPACSTVSVSAYDLGYSCYPTGIDMRAMINGVLESSGGGGGSDPGNCFELPDHSIECDDFPGGGGGGGGNIVRWYFSSIDVTVGICVRSCLWEDPYAI